MVPLLNMLHPFFLLKYRCVVNLAKWLFVTPADPCHVGVQLWSKSGRMLGLCQEAALDPKREHGSSGIPKLPKRDSDMRDCPTEGSRLNEGSGIVLSFPH